jgi:hypothetical protein
MGLAAQNYTGRESFVLSGSQSLTQNSLGTAAYFTSERTRSERNPAGVNDDDDVGV